MTSPPDAPPLESDPASRTAWRAAGPLLVAAYGLALVLTLPDYGVTWDEPGWFTVGDRHLRFFATLDPAEIAPREGQGGWDAYGPFASIVISSTGALFHDALGWLARDTARHVGNVLFALLAAAALLRCVGARDGPRVAALALVAFATLPRWFGHAHNNPSDMPAAACVIASLACVTAYSQTGRRISAVWLGASLAAAAAIRPQTAIFVPLVIGGWIALCPALRARLRSRPADVAVVAGTGCVAFFALWPMLWTAPVANGGYALEFFLHPPAIQGAIAPFYLGERIEAGAPWHYPFVMTLVTTPVPWLGLAAWGAVASIRAGGRRRQSALLALWWAGVAIGVHAFLSRGNYDGIRHFLEAFGGLAWLAGLGLSDLAGRFARWRGLGPALCVLSLLPGVAAIAALHPYPQVYFNVLAAGGLPNAARHFETDYWGFSWKPAMEWVNANTPRGAVLVVPWLQGQLTFYRRADLRLGVAALPAFVERERQKAAQDPRGDGRGAREVYFLFNVKQGLIRESGAIPYVRERFPRVHTVEKAGTTLFEIYRLD